MPEDTCSLLHSLPDFHDSARISLGWAGGASLSTGASVAVSMRTGRRDALRYLFGPLRVVPRLTQLLSRILRH